MRQTHWLVFMALTLVMAGGWAGPHAGEKNKPAQGAVLLVTDFSGKEHKLKSWKFVTGTQSLSWLAPADKTPDPPKKEEPTAKGKARPIAGPVALEFSEGKGAPLKRRVVSYLLLEHIRAIEFDHKKDLMIVRIAKSEKEEEDDVQYGLTGYIGMNTLAIEAQVDLGELGQAEVKFQGGVARGVSKIRFPSPKPAPATATGRSAVVTATDRTKSVHAVVDLQPLYAQQDGRLQTLPTLFFQKTVKIDVAKIAKLSQVGSGTSTGLTYDVALKDGTQHPLTLIERTTSAESRPLFLEGLVGRVPAGYKVFPMSVIGEAQFDEKGK